MPKPFYITTTLPYVNAEPHVGFALEIIRADVIARQKRKEGYDVFFNTGTDEHGQKIFQSAQKAGVTPQEYADSVVQTVKGLTPMLNLSNPNFIRTTDEHHVKAAQKFWEVCDKAGYIYKKQYATKYCVGCELEKTDSELVDGKCPIHQTVPEINNEENYFFKLSAFGNQLLALYESHPNFVVPAFRLEEMKVFVKGGLQDFSISRLASKMSWGIPVPNDPEQVMYVWFDALVNYIAAIGWPHDMATFQKYWNEAGGVVQICGKDNVRQQTVIWQAMLMAAGIKPSQHVIINGFINGEGGVKMSKSLGNVISPQEVIEKYDIDTLRYFVCKELHPFEDSAFTWERLNTSYNSGLANGIGNLTSRVLKMATSYNVEYEVSEFEAGKMVSDLREKVSKSIGNFNIHEACEHIWNAIADADRHIQETQPFKLVKTDEVKGKEVVKELIERLYAIADVLAPIIPTTSETILNLIAEKKIPEKPLFERKEK